MATLYVIGTPAGDPGDLTLRGKRLLEEVALIAADGLDRARRLMTRYALATPLIPTAEGGRLLDTLRTDDTAILIEGGAPFPSGLAYELIHVAIQRDFPVVPVPGPAFPITALILSGLPADSFVHLGELPTEPVARCNLLTLVAAERRTLVVIARFGHLPGALSDLHDVLGDRSLAVFTTSERGTTALWRGTLGQALERAWTEATQERHVLVVGGARDQVTRWDEDQLRAQVRASLDLGLGAKEIGRQLAAQSGWPRREIYRLAVDISHSGLGTRKGL